MPLKNFYESIKGYKVLNPNYDKHHMSVPFRAIESAPSGSGKSNLALNLIALMDKTFHEIIVCVLSASEPLYELLGQLNGVKFYEGGVVPPLSEFEKKDENGKIKPKDDLQRLMIFDDLVLSVPANKIIAEYYIKARKLNISLLYLSQSFYQIPKVIRINSQYLILGKNLLTRDLNTIMREFPTNMTPAEFQELYEELTEQPMSSITIDIAKRKIWKNINEVSIDI